MKRLLRVGITLGLVFFVSGCQNPPVEALQSDQTYERANDPRHADTPYVLLISIDGYRYDYTDLYDPPNLERFADEGVRAEGLIPIYPSDTFPNQYSIVTGMYPGTHGIVANSFFDSERDARYQLGDTEAVRDGSWYGGTPIWVAASYFWVGSEADIQGIRPTYYHTYDPAVSHADRVDGVLEWLSYPLEYRPHFITLYFSAIDSEAHDSGTTSTELQGAIRRLDSQMGSLFDRIEDLEFDVNVFIVSDHGMVDLDPERVVYLDDLVSLEGVRVGSLGAHSFLYVDDARRRSEVYANLQRQEDHYRVYRRTDTPVSWHTNHYRIGDLIVEAEPPYSISLRTRSADFSGGAHGYDPYRYREMHGIFYARGPDLVERIVVPRFENVHIYLLIMEILELETLMDIDGRGEVLAGILKGGN